MNIIKYSHNIFMNALASRASHFRINNHILTFSISHYCTINVYNFDSILDYG